MKGINIDAALIWKSPHMQRVFTKMGSWALPMLEPDWLMLWFCRRAHDNKIPFHSEGPIHQSGPYVGAARGSQLSCMFYWSYGIFLIWHIALHHPINFPTVTCHGSVYQFGFDVTLIIRFMPFGIRGLWILHRHQQYSTSTQLRLLIISGSVQF